MMWLDVSNPLFESRKPSSISDTRYISKVNEREIELQGLLAATQAELNAIKSKKLKLQSNTSLGTLHSLPDSSRADKLYS